MSPLELTEQEFIDLPWIPTIRQRIKELIDCSDFRVIVAIHQENKLKAIGFHEIPEQFPDETVGLFLLPDIRLDNLSRTQKAIRLVKKKGYSVHKASKLVGVNHASVFRALKNRKDKEICPTCNQVVRDGFTLSQT